MAWQMTTHREVAVTFSNAVANLSQTAMYVENRTKIANFHTPRVFNAPADGVPRAS